MKRVVLFFSLLLLVVANLYAATDYDKKLGNFKEKINDSKKTLNTIESEIKQKRKDKNIIEKEEKNTAQEIKSIDVDLSKNREELLKLTKNLFDTESKIEEIKEELTIIQQDKEEHLEILKKELCFIYIERLWNVSEWDFWAKGLISVKSLSELIKKYEFLKLITRQRLINFQRAQKNEEEIEKLRKDLTSEKDSFEKIKKEGKQKQDIFLSNKNKKNILLTSLHDKKLFYENEIRDLKDSAQALQGLVDLLEKKATLIEEEKKRGLIMTQKRGDLVWPIEGKVISMFGKHKHPEYGTYIINNGIEIKSTAARIVKSVSSGKVMFADDFQTYGKMIIIDHGGGFYSIYGRLANFKTSIGNRVEEGEVIAEINNPLYFEIREKGSPRDPLVWLQNR